MFTFATTNVPGSSRRCAQSFKKQGGRRSEQRSHHSTICRVNGKELKVNLAGEYYQSSHTGRAIHYRRQSADADDIPARALGRRP